MREIRQSGSEGGAAQTNGLSLPLSRKKEQRSCEGVRGAKLPSFSASFGAHLNATSYFQDLQGVFRRNRKPI